MNSVKGHILQLESDLLKSEVRKSAQTISDILADDCILAMYKVIKHDEPDENKKYSLRSSIWKYINGKWKMFFHQGTYTSKFDIK